MLVQWNDIQNNGQTEYLFFPSLIGQDAEPIAGASSPAVEIYKDGSDTPITAGQTLSIVNSNAGFYRLALDLSNVAYTAGNYCVVWSAGTADSKALDGRSIGIFSIDRYATSEEVWDGESAEPSAIPDLATATRGEKLDMLFALFFHKSTVTSALRRIFKLDGTTVLSEETLSDNGTTMTKAVAEAP